MNSNKKVQGMISDIQTFSLHDGPGIRTTVFLKGCPLRCVWCHNPETYDMKPQASRITRKCVSCGKCAAVCPKSIIGTDGRHLDAEKCISCGKCVEACPIEATVMIGSLKTPEEVLETVLRDRIFYEHSGGGVTLSGGEPLLQPEFTYELLSLLKKEGIHTAVETCGFAGEGTVRRIAEVADLFLYDCKETDEDLHLKWTGVSREPIVKNLELLSELGAKVVLRCPVIPGFNDRQDHFAAIAELASRPDCIEYVELMPYHNIGLDKAEQIGIPRRDDVRVPDRAETLSWRTSIAEAGCKKEIRI